MARTPPPKPGGRGGRTMPFGGNRAPPFGRGKPPGRGAAAERKEERKERENDRGKRR